MPKTFAVHYFVDAANDDRPCVEPMPCPDHPALFQSRHNIVSYQILLHFDAEFRNKAITHITKISGSLAQPRVFDDIWYKPLFLNFLTSFVDLQEKNFRANVWLVLVSQHYVLSELS